MKHRKRTTLWKHDIHEKQQPQIRKHVKNFQIKKIKKLVQHTRTLIHHTRIRFNQEMERGKPEKMQELVVLLPSETTALLSDCVK